MPLKIGIHLDLIELTKSFDNPPNDKLLRQALRMYVMPYTYQVAVSAAGAKRINLQGEVVEVVSELHRQQAVEVIKDRKAKNLKRRLEAKKRQAVKPAISCRSSKEPDKGVSSKPVVGVNAHLPRLHLKKNSNST